MANESESYSGDLYRRHSSNLIHTKQAELSMMNRTGVPPIRRERPSSCQLCDRPDTGEMVQCDNCNLWHQYQCAGVDDEVNNVSWSCEKCIIVSQAIAERSQHSSRRSKTSSARQRAAALQLLNEEKALEDANAAKEEALEIEERNAIQAAEVARLRIAAEERAAAARIAEEESVAQLAADRIAASKKALAKQKQRDTEYLRKKAEMLAEESKSQASGSEDYLYI